MNKLNFEYVPLTFISDKQEIRKQIKNTLILIYLFKKYNSPVRLENLIEGTQYGYNASALESGKNKFLRISDIHESKVNWETVPYCNCDDAKTYLLKNDDILIARTGGTTGKSFKIKNPPELSIYAGYLIRIRAKKTVNPDYIYLFLHSFAYWSQIVNMNEGNFRPKANAENLKSLILPDCAKEFQDEAVLISQGEKVKGYEDLFSNIESTLKEYDKSQKIEDLLLNQLSQIQNLNQAILQDAVQGKLVPQDLNDEPASELLKKIRAEKTSLGFKEKVVNYNIKEFPFEIHDNWKWCRLWEIIYNTESGKSPNCLHEPVKGKEWGVIKTTAVQEMVFLENENKILPIGFVVNEQHKIYEGDILITRAGPKNRVGVVCCVENLTRNLILSDKTIRIKYPKHLLYSKFIALAFNSPIMKPFIESKMVGMAESQVNITQDNLQELLIPLPPLEEQKRIVIEIEKQFAKTKQLKEHIIANQQASEQLLKALLHQAFEVERLK